MGANPVELASFAAAADPVNACEFTLDAAVYPVGPVSTPVLLDALAGADVTAVVPGMVAPRERAHLYAALHQASSGVTGRLLTRIACEVVGQLAGCPWWSALSLAVALRADWWAFDATARLESGIDLLALPLPRCLSTVYALSTRYLDDDKRAQAQALVWERPAWADQLDNQAPPTGPPRRKSRWTPQQQYASFQAFATLGAAYNAAG